MRGEGRAYPVLDTEVRVILFSHCSCCGAIYRALL